MIGLPIDHIAVAVPSIIDAAPLYERISGGERSEIETLTEQGVNVCFVGEIELLEPLTAESSVSRFLDRQGPGIHHLAFRCADIRSELARLRSEGFTPIDEQPRLGARGHLVAFLHPRETGKVLIELVEHA